MHYLTCQITGDPDLGGSSLLTENQHAVGVFHTSGGGAMRKIPNSARWVESRTGAGNGPWVDTTGDLHPDDDPITAGGARPTAVIDIFSMLSNKLGKEVAQEKIAYIEHIGLRLRNSGNGGNNNEESVGFTGTLAWYAPKRDRIRAYKMYRQAHRIMKKDDTANNLVFSPSTDYRSLRVGPFLHPNTSTWSTVPYQDTDFMSDVGTASFSDGVALNEIFLAYDRMNGVLDGNGDILYDGKPNNLNWLSGRCLAAPDTMHFSVGISNPKDGGPGAGYQDFLWVGPQISLMNGLLVLTIDNCTTTNSLTGMGWTDEEFELEINIGVKGWKGIA